MATHSAPWSTSLVVSSTLASALCLGVSAWTYVHPWPTHAFSVIPLAILAGAALFTIRGYEVTAGELCIRRLLWTDHLPLHDLQAVRIEPNVMRGSMRIFGNGGMFSFSGLYRNAALGTYHAYVTDPARTVVLMLPKRTVVVSPASPQRLMLELETLERRK